MMGRRPLDPLRELADGASQWVCLLADTDPGAVRLNDLQ